MSQNTIDNCGIRGCTPEHILHCCRRSDFHAGAGRNRGSGGGSRGGVRCGWRGDMHKGGGEVATLGGGEPHSARHKTSGKPSSTARHQCLHEGRGQQRRKPECQAPVAREEGAEVGEGREGGSASTGGHRAVRESRAGWGDRPPPPTIHSVRRGFGSSCSALGTGE